MSVNIDLDQQLARVYEEFAIVDGPKIAPACPGRKEVHQK